MNTPRGLPQAICGFHQDDEAHWVAELACGHHQHVRHDPPWQQRPWVQTEQGRAQFMGHVLSCVRCIEDQQSCKTDAQVTPIL